MLNAIPSFWQPAHRAWLCLLCLYLVPGLAARAQSITLNGPAGSGEFGRVITVLPNGNYVVVDPRYDNGSTLDVGAVYLYNGNTDALISTLTGSSANDRIGINGITVLPNGHYVVVSRSWDNGPATDAGAVTWCNSSTGVNGAVSASNSLVGSRSGDGSGIEPLLVLPNGNYLIQSRRWDNGAATDAGAVTWCSGSAGRTGPISASNSLVGARTGDQVGSNGITVLPNGHYLVASAFWDNGTATDAGAVTWCNGNGSTVGAVSASNSLVGSRNNDNVGRNSFFEGSIVVLTNGHYVVSSTNWDNGTVVNAGAVTWCNGNSGRAGAISASNSLVGSRTSDQVGNWGIQRLANGHYVVVSHNWDNGTVADAGAVTWGNGTSGRVGAVSASNSLVGARAQDFYNFSVYNLPNGHYVVVSPQWNNGSLNDAGAVTWCNGTVGRTGTISAGTSLVGTQVDGMIGSGRVTVLTNGNYVVNSPYWSNGFNTSAGAVTWCSGTAGRVGAVSASNSLVGTNGGDYVGRYGTTALANGHYVVASAEWDNGSTSNAGAATWCNGTTGRVGAVSASNSLVGSRSYDGVGDDVTALPNGHYVVGSPYWDNAATTDAGAVTWCNGTAGRTGTINTGNSLVGSRPSDRVGYSNSGMVTILANGNYLVTSPFWNNGAATSAGAITWCSGTAGRSGAVGASNSLVGASTNESLGGSYGAVTTLPNGSYVVRNSSWANGTAAGAGAVTWGSASSGVSGVISAANSLVGTAANDGVGSYGIGVLSNGNYVVSSPDWDNGTVADAGAVTWGSGTAGRVGAVSVSNSLIGSRLNDRVGDGGIGPLSNGNYVVHSQSWDNGTITDAGALTLVNSTAATTGNVNACSSIAGGVASSGNAVSYAYLPNRGLLLAGLWRENKIIIRQGPTLAPTGEATQPGRTVADLQASGAGVQWYAAASGGSPLPATAPLTTGNQYYATQTLNGCESSQRLAVTAATPLPVELLEFAAERAGATAQLRWRTASERNSDFFDVEVGTDGKTFRAIGQVAAQGHSTRPTAYSLADPELLAYAVPAVYYRLKQVDLDGAFAYSPVRTVEVEATAGGLVASPVPARSSLRLESHNTALLGQSATVYDLLGRPVHRFVLQPSQELDVRAWPSGVYVLRLADGSSLRLVRE